jgi:sulfatase maturation enzyme AslB (radical SAM superfamily)
MNCPFCFAPSKDQTCSEPTSLLQWKRIIDLLHSWAVEGITFSGGDPFAKEDFPELLSYTHESSNRTVFIQVDTNGIGIKPNHFTPLKKCVDLLGLPLDGARPEIHCLLRGENHFKIMIHLLPELVRHQIPLKINTIVSNKNIESLEEIGYLLKSIPVKIWSLYEFWSLGKVGIANPSEFEIPHSLFTEKTNTIISQFPNLPIEINSIQNRRSAYFFVNDQSIAYTIDKKDPSRYSILGSIFSEDVLVKWLQEADPLAVQKRLEQRREASTQ